MADSINKAILIGRMGQDPEIKYTQSGAAVCNFSLATSENFKDASGNRQERTEWHRIVCWNKQAEFVQKYLGKGRLVYVEGKIQTREWQDQSGSKRYTTEINAFQVQFMDSKNEQQGGNGGGQAPYQQGRPQQQQPQNQAPNNQQGNSDEIGSAFPSEPGKWPNDVSF